MKHLLGFLALCISSFAATDALAYIGPGTGISAIGSVIALFGVVALAIAGFVWYPVKRLRRRLKGKPVSMAQPAKGEDTAE